MSVRRPFLDWLRIIVVLLLIPYHTAWIFSPYSWFLNDAHPNLFAQTLIFVQDRYHMDLLFLIAGAAAFSSLGVRSPAGYLMERLQRLGLPMLTATLLLVPPCYWLAARPGGGFISLLSYYSVFWSNLVHSSDVTANSGVVWFIWVLLFCVVTTAPFFIYLRRSCNEAFFEKLSHPFSHPLGIFALFLPVLASLLFFPDYLAIFTNHVIFFVYGFFIFSAPGFEKGLTRSGPVACALAVASLTILTLLVFPDTAHSAAGPGLFSVLGSAKTGAGFALLQVLGAITTCSILVSLLCLARRFLNFSNRFVVYGNDVVLPFYLIHCTLLVLIGRWVITQAWPTAVKFGFIGMTSLASTLLACELVRRSGVARFLFSMRHKNFMQRTKALPKTFMKESAPIIS